MIRLVGALALVFVGGALVLYLLTGEPRYRALAWTFTRIGALLVLAFLALLFIERLIGPLL